MSGSPRGSRPRTAYVEDYNEDVQDTVPGTRQSANVAAKRSKPEIRKMKRYETSDSDHSGHAIATGDSSSQGMKKAPATSTKNGLLKKAAKKLAGAAMRQPAKEPSPPPKPVLKRGMSRTQKKENLRLEITESRADAAKMRLSGQPRESPTDPPPLRRPHPEIHGPYPPQIVRIPTSAPTQSIPISRPAKTPSRSSNTLSYKTRPTSYHEGLMWETAYAHTPLSFPDHGMHPPPMSLNHYPPQSYPPPPSAAPVMYIPTPLQTSPNRQINYPFQPTAPPTFEHPYVTPPSHGWRSDIYHQQHAPQPPPRPVSMQSSGSFGDYPPIPLGYHAVPSHHFGDPSVRRPSLHQFEPQPIFQLDDEQHMFEDDESYYRDRKLMPPPPIPQRPIIRHAATTANARRSKRDSLDLTSQFPRKQSLEEARPTSRPSLSSRNSNNKNQIIMAEAMPSPTASRRRQRPISYHGGPELEKQVLDYQDAVAGHARPLHLTTDDIQKAKGKRNAKTHRSGGGSDTGSRASSGKGSGTTKRRKSQERQKGNTGGNEGFSVRFPASQGVKLNLRGEEPQTISLRHSLEGNGGMELNIKPQSRPREGSSVREKERLIMERRHSTAGRRDVRQIKESDEREGSGRTRSRSRAVGEERAADNDLMERFKRLTTDTRSRRNSSRGMMAPPITPNFGGQMNMI